MSDKKEYTEWIKKAETARDALWELYNQDIEGDDRVAMYALSAFKSAHSLVEFIQKQREEGGEDENE